MAKEEQAPPILDPVARELLREHGPVVDPPTAARLTKYAEGTLANMRGRGVGPVFYRVNRSIRYDLLDVLRFVRGERSVE